MNNLVKDCPKHGGSVMAGSSCSHCMQEEAWKGKWNPAKDGHWHILVKIKTSTHPDKCLIAESYPEGKIWIGDLEITDKVEYWCEIPEQEYRK